MSETPNPAIVNEIVVEETMINGWPSNFSGCWINISPEDPLAFDITAELLNDNQHEEGAIIRSNKKYHPDCVAIITWQKTGEIKFLWVNDEYRGSKIGYSLGIWLRTYLAKDGVRVLHSFIQERNDVVEEFLKKFKEDYQAEDIILRESYENAPEI